ncbi:MAG: hypothetical protein U0M63_12550 [Alistipes onderdonkii]|jgi:hypothetical protein|uniref:hypothetical protein n=1 Tax=Alistipes onderdonkii TaxID=328813 RepID=UPI001875EA37|nr:hypothetical protein [Alistipes onderdonkii]MBE5046134.1 hypothetical protein [Alistipes onderdonkii]MEE0850481.1 hypothetical protein [Alistipes onderdonkii]
MIEKKVRLHHVDAGFCLEVWEVKREKGKPQYYVGRETVGQRQWTTLCDAPDGYCEPWYAISRKVVFILCDRQWREIGRDGNDRTLFPVPPESRL